MNNRTEFFKFVIPSIIAFALSGIYAIVDGFFVGNTIGDAGLSAINMAYPVVAVIQAVGTGIGMGGAVYYSISKAENKKKRAEEFAATSWWLLIIASILLTIIIYCFAEPVLVALGMQKKILSYGVEYIKVIAFGAVLQVLGTGLIPLMRNYNGSFMAMIAMVGGFVTNIILDFLLVWVYGYGIKGAALATIIGQGVTALTAIIYSVHKKCFFVRVSMNYALSLVSSIFKVGLAPFGLALTPNISLVIINRFSVQYGGEKAIATYACIGYIICIIYLVLQGVGDGSQPLMSQYYGEKREADLKEIRKMAYTLAIFLAIVGCVLMFVARWKIGTLFGASDEVNINTGKIIPIFLISVPFVAITRVSTAGFYATEKSILSYILTFIEPVLMLILMLILPPLLGGQIMIWWSTVIARIVSAVLALYLIKKSNKEL
ncbi:MAG TPA: multidrug transporter MatE [Lachnospiraceae bacterium]|nr:MATE family efflux transporter [uncultured Lachnoclostridium sp.]HAU87007.1 multidrug transporter MatE [Lachnospiraceae bacterium]